jgi:hypothetical protein
MRRAFLAGCILLCINLFAGAGVELHVAPDGNDLASGEKAAPFRTLERARDEIRRLKADGSPKGAITVWVHDGTYCIAQTFELGPEDSGTADAPITYRAYRNCKPILVGARPVTGFTSYRGLILKADVGSLGIRNYFRQLFFDGKRQPLARYPNFDPDNPYGGGWAYADGKLIPMLEDHAAEPKNELHFKKRDARSWSRPQEGEVFVFPRYNWWNNIVSIKAVDQNQRVITLAQDASYSIRPNDRYYVQNLFEELDAPGEWYLDKHDQMLYFWPPSTLEGKMVYVPIVRTILKFNPGAAHITFRGFTLQYCEGTAVELNGASDCLIAGNTIRNVGDYNGDGVDLNGGNDNGIVGNDINFTGSRGISISGGDFHTLAAGGNYADNNYIHHTGVFYKQGSGITLAGVGNRASHNLIHDEPRYGIDFSGNDHIIEFNHIRHVCIETSDTSAINSWNVSWTRRGTVIRYNYLHDILGYGQEDGRWASPHYAWGIYLDDMTCGTSVFGNIVARAPFGGVHIHSGRDNIIENNIFVDGASRQVTYTGYDPKDDVTIMMNNSKPFLQNAVYLKKYPVLKNFDLKTAWQMAGNKFLRNIISYRDPNAALFDFVNLPFEQTESDFNLFYHFGRPVKNRGAIPAGMEAAFKKLDEHSVVSDPLFMAAEKDDYRLRDNSPAIKLGFQPIPVEKIGPYADDLRASWPIVETPGVREHPLQTMPKSSER